MDEKKLQEALAQESVEDTMLEKLSGGARAFHVNLNEEAGKGKEPTIFNVAVIREERDCLLCACDAMVVKNN